MGRLWYLIREYFFPRGCGICGASLFTKNEAWYGLCNDCRKEIVIGADIRCDMCGRPLISEINQCLPCRKSAETGETAMEKPLIDKMVSVFPYTGKYKKLLGAFKYERSPGAGHFLAEKIIEAIKLFPLENNNPAPRDADLALVPVPPRPGKIRRTGWDQIETLSKLLAQSKDSPGIIRCLKRKASKTQKKLDRKERKTNLIGRITARRSPLRVPSICILFDDVITTGSTMNACARALKQAGAEKVFGICLFYD